MFIECNFKYINTIILKVIMVKLQIAKRGNTVQGIITIPRAIWEGKKWKDGQELLFTFGPKGEVILEEK